MTQPPSTPCSRIHRGTLSSRVAAQITWVRPKRINTDPIALRGWASPESQLRGVRRGPPSVKFHEARQIGASRSHGCKNLNSPLGGKLTTGARIWSEERRDYRSLLPIGLASYRFRAARAASNCVRTSPRNVFSLLKKWSGREIRTRAFMRPNEALYQAEPRPD